MLVLNIEVLRDGVHLRFILFTWGTWSINYISAFEPLHYGQPFQPWAIMYHTLGSNQQKDSTITSLKHCCNLPLISVCLWRQWKTSSGLQLLENFAPLMCERKYRISEVEKCHTMAINKRWGVISEQHRAGNNKNDK